VRRGGAREVRWRSEVASRGKTVEGLGAPAGDEERAGASAASGVQEEEDD
jgi:hypothetical protein